VSSKHIILLKLCCLLCLDMDALHTTTLDTIHRHICSQDPGEAVVRASLLLNLC
jgi:hypothetical protein